MAKAASWQVFGIVTMSMLGFLFTGSLSSGGALAVLSSLLGFVSYLAHERVWASIGWGMAGTSPRGASETATGAERPRLPVAGNASRATS
ncbi:hypothetical protein ATO4_22860 [Aurantimonas sp. 22II-16-19i]|nr:hypothetical protein ATO4_22860 [Aurantimonas sp. 22II-16-19i]